MKNVEKEHKEWEKIFTNHVSDKEVVSKIYKVYLQLNNKRMNNLLKNWGKDLNRHFSKEGKKWPLST